MFWRCLGRIFLTGFLQILDRQGTSVRLPIKFGNFANDRDCLLISTSPDEIPWALIKPEEGEAHTPQEKGKSTEGKHQVSPSHVLSPIARGGVELTRKIRDQGPGNLLNRPLAALRITSGRVVYQTPKELSYCPPPRHNCEQILVRRWYKV